MTNQGKILNLKNRPAIGNPETEQAVLGGMLLNPAAVGQVLKILSPEHFTSEPLRILYRGITTLHEKGMPADKVTLYELLRQNGGLEKVGGVTFIDGLTENVGFASNVLDYAQIVRVKADRRRKRDLGLQLAQACEKGESTDLIEKQIAETRSPAVPQFFITAKELSLKEFIDPEWIVPEILPEGLCLLSARPKKGKTWMALNLAVGVAMGSYAFGKEELRVKQGVALYMALEDGLRRIKGRLKKILGDSAFPDDLVIAESWPRLHKGGFEELRGWLKEHPDCRLVVVDSFSKIKPPRPKNADPYEFDMAVVGSLQKLARDAGICLLLIYHNRKAEAVDPLDEVIGSTGTTGAVDAVLVLRRGRGTADGTLFVSGRDVQEQELAMRFHPGEGLWELIGTAAECAISQLRQDILLILRQGPKKAAQLAYILEKPKETIRKTLARMKDAGMVRLKQNDEYEIM